MLVERAGKATLHADDSSLGKSLIIAGSIVCFLAVTALRQCGSIHLLAFVAHLKNHSE
jgi:hypothetical protein